MSQHLSDQYQHPETQQRQILYHEKNEQNEQHIIEQSDQVEKQEISLENQPQSKQVESTQITEIKESEKPSITKLQDFANQTIYLEQEQTIKNGISIKISGNVQKGSALSKYTAYVIIGEDQKGKFQILRRYSQFDALRIIMKDRWPGCFIPTLPDKTIAKNSPQTIQERERVLDDFLKKIGHSKSLFYSQEFQLFLRSGQGDLTATYQKLPKSTLEEIITRYKESFSELAGKEVNSDASIKISTFKTGLKKIQQQIPFLQQAAFNLAESKDRLNEKLPNLFNVINRYQKNTILQFSEGREDTLVYLKPSNASFINHAQTLKNVSKGNPFWLINDLVKIEIKDCASFIQTLQMIDTYNDRRIQCEMNIKSYELEIEELALGRSTVSSMTTRKTKQEVKKTIEQKNRNAIVQKHQLIELIDMMVALLAYIQIDKYKNMKKKYYSSLIKKFTGYQAFLVINLDNLWKQVAKATEPASTVVKEQIVQKSPQKSTEVEIVTKAQ